MHTYIMQIKTLILDVINRLTAQTLFFFLTLADMVTVNCHCIKNTKNVCISCITFFIWGNCFFKYPLKRCSKNDQVMNISTSQCKETKGPIIHTVQSGTRCRTSVFASFSLTQFSFSHPVPCCLDSKCICTHLCAHRHAGLKTRCVQAHCWHIFWGTENRLRHRPTQT